MHNTQFTGKIYTLDFLKDNAETKFLSGEFNNTKIQVWSDKDEEIATKIIIEFFDIPISKGYSFSIGKTDYGTDDADEFSEEENSKDATNFLLWAIGENLK